MKRLLCVLLAVALTFTLCACSEGQSVMDKFTDNVNSLVTVGLDQQTTTPATKHEVALKRGNEVGNVCYNAQLPIITAKGMGVALDFGLELVRALKDSEIAENIKKSVFAK